MILHLVIAFGICTNAPACYDYNTQRIGINAPLAGPQLVHELGHAHYFAQSPQYRREVAVGDPTLRNEEAYADLFTACLLGQGPRWLRNNLYGVHVGPNRFKRICRMIRHS